MYCIIVEYNWLDVHAAICSVQSSIIWTRFKCCSKFHLRRNFFWHILHTIFFSTPHSWFMWRNIMLRVEYHLPHFWHGKFCPLRRWNFGLYASSAYCAKNMNSPHLSGSNRRFVFCFFWFVLYDFFLWFVCVCVCVSIKYAFFVTPLVGYCTMTFCCC